MNWDPSPLLRTRHAVLSDTAEAPRTARSPQRWQDGEIGADDNVTR
jgi:hypothetical protein